MPDEVGAGYLLAFEAGASGKDEVMSGKALFADSYSVGVKEIGVAFDAGDAGVFKDFLAVTAGLDDDFELVGGDSGKIKMKILVAEFGKSLDSGVGMGKVEGDGVRNVAGVKIGATKITAFDKGDAFFGLGELQSNGGTGWTAPNNYIIKIVFFTHLYIILSRFL